MLRYDTIHRLALDEGFSLCGIARARVLNEHKQRLDRWVEKGYHGGLDYVKDRTAILPDPYALVENAKTIVVCAVHYKNEAWDQTARGVIPKIASYSYARDYHKTLRKMLANVFKKLKESYPQLNGRYFTDAVPMLEKAWAVEAGLGWIGRNSLLITPRYGSFILLGELILDMECDIYDMPFEGERCGNCSMCVESCPTGAIMSGRVIDASRCISRLTVEKMPEDDPADAELHGWLFGCDECQGCCPYNQRTPMYSNPVFAPVIHPSLTDAEFWRKMDQQRLQDIFSPTPLKRSIGKILSRVKKKD